MGLFQIASALLIALTSLLPASCHKTSPQQKKVPTAPAATIPVSTIAKPTPPAPKITPAIHQLGDIVLTNHFETCVFLGDGKSCILTPRVITREKFQITLRLESKTAVGQTSDLSVTRIIAKNGKPLEIAIGNENLILTPRLKVN